MNTQSIRIITSLFLLSGSMTLSYPADAQARYTVDGTITDSSNGETLTGVSIYCKEIGTGAVTNLYGFYSLTLPQGEYTLEISFVGFIKVIRKISLHQNLKINLELLSETRQLNEVTVVASDADNPMNVRSMEMSTNHLDLTTIQKLPALLGETDVIKSLQFLPGVSQVGEGSSGFNVRGGSTGQNLVLLDEAPVYNSSHMLGFFSVFNPDAIKDVKLYKGAIPANFGGRTSSVLDVRMKEGNMKEYSFNGGVGLIFSRLSVEGPIIPDKSSFIVAARRSYIDLLSKPFLDNDIGLNFHDVTLKSNYIVNAKNRLFLSGYSGRDVFKLSDDAGFSWGNQTATLRWNSIINSRLFSNVSMVYSNYNYKLNFSDDDDSMLWNSAITNYVIRPDFNFYINERSELTFGAEGVYYRFNPATTRGTSNGEDFDSSLENKFALETAGYISLRQTLSPAWEASIGLRTSSFQYLGPGTAYTYNDTIPGKRRSVVSEEHYGRNETIASYLTPEPRASIKYQLSDFASLKASYSRTAQYIHFISNTTASNPLNVWTPSTNNLKPTTSHQLTLGYFTTLGKAKGFEASAEVYYKNSRNEVDYINGAEILSNAHLEGDLLSGAGRAYGIELYLQKKTGRFTGWASYTLSRSELKIDGINKGKWYPARYDQTHNLKLVGMLTINEYWSVTTDFVFTTGTPTTYPDQRYLSQGLLIPYNSQNTRNDVRLSSYHRLDLSFRLEGKTYRKNGKKRKVDDYWVFSIYNVYARKNAFSTYFSQSDDRLTTGQVAQAEAHRVSIIGTMVPSISYNFNF